MDTTPHRPINSPAWSWRAPLRPAFSLLRRHLATYVAVNVVGYALFVTSAVIAGSGLHEWAVGSSSGTTSTGLVAWVAQFYVDGNIPVAALLTVVANLVIGAFLLTTAPSLVVPFSGALYTGYQAVLWGALYSPAVEQPEGNWLHVIVLVVELQAYLIVVVIAIVQGRMFLQPNRFGIQGRFNGYKAGLAETLKSYPLVVAILVPAGIFEAIEVIGSIPASP